MMNTHDLVIALNREVRDKWRSIEGQYDFWDSGFALFYSPVIEEPNLMIIGYNPGGDSTSFSEQKAMSIPTEHEYIASSYKIAVKMRELLAGIKGIKNNDIIRESVKLNLIFFRSNKIAEWHGLDKNLRTDLESFCFQKVRDIVNVIRPHFILTEGMKTFDTLTTSILSDQCSKPVYQYGHSNSRRLYARCRAGNIEIIGIIHPSGARIRNEEWDQIKENLRKDLRHY